MGGATKRSNGIFLDDGGDDTYTLDADARGWGMADEDETYTRPGPGVAYPFHIGQVGLFLDAGGTDTYLRRQANGETTPDGDAGNTRSWHLRKRDPVSRAGPNVSLGRDVARGRFGFLDPWPARVAAATGPNPTGPARLLP